MIDLRSVMSSRRLAAALVLGVGLWSSTASAHIELTTPASRYSSDTQKAPPCGHPDNPPGAGPVATYQAGETITVEFQEFVDHPGHFRISLDPTGTDAFTSPTAFDDFYNSPEVLLDDIADMGGGAYSIEVTLPDTPCDPCTLQLIQVMNDGAFGPGDSDLYFACADIVIEPVGGETGGSTTGADTGGDVSSGGGSADSGVGDVGSGDPGSEGGGSSSGSVMDPSEGTGTGEPTGTSDPGDSPEEASSCSCRADAGVPATAAPWLIVVLVARRRRRG